FHMWSTAVGVTTTLNGGDGNDQFTFGDANGTMDGIRGPLALNGQAGSNTVVFYDLLSAAGHTYSFAGDTLIRDGMAPVRHSGMVQLVHYTGTGDDRVEWGMSAQFPVLRWADQAGTDTLVGPDAVNVWQLIAGTSELYANGNLAVTFNGADNLIGGAGADTFVIADGVAAGGFVDGGGGNNLLDYSAWTT